MLPGPGVVLHQPDGVGRDGLDRLAVALRRAQEVLDQIVDVVDALAQRRQADRHDVEAVVEILAEEALPDHLAEVAVRRGDDADVGLDRRAAADHGVLALLQHAQQAGLGIHRHVADFVEEERAALGLLEAARTSGRWRR